MKKIIIALSAALIIISFTGCDTQKKIDEVLAREKATLISFIDTRDAAEKYNSFMRYKSTYNLSDFNSGEKTEKERESIENIIYRILSFSDNNQYAPFTSSDTNKTIESATGTIEALKSEDGTTYTLTLKNVSIKASYTTVEGDSVNASLTLDGVIYQKKTTDDEDETIVYKVTDFTENGTSYLDIELTVLLSGPPYTSEVTKAVCGGKNVDLDILNKYDFSNMNFV